MINRKFTATVNPDAATHDRSDGVFGIQGPQDLTMTQTLLETSRLFRSAHSTRKNANDHR